MKKSIYRKLSIYLPLIIGFCVLLYASNAYAGFFDWVVEKASEAVAKKLGIDTEDNCQVPGGHSGCIFCDMFKVLFNAGSNVAGVSYNAFSSGLGQLILTFLAVSLAVIILKNVASFGARDPGTLLNDLLKKTFVCVGIYIIVTQDYFHILNLTLTPIFETGLSFAGSGSSTCSSAGGVNGFAVSAGSGASGGIPASVGEMIVCAVEDIEHKIFTLFDYGEWAFCRGNGPDRLWHILPHPVYIIDGILLYIGGVFFIVTYPWVMGDAVLQLGIAMAFVPFAIAGYAFDGTKGYLGKVFSWILHSLFVFIFMAILINCILEYINSVLNAHVAGGAADPKALFTDPVNGVAFYGPNMLMIIFILVIGWTYMPVTTDLAGEFSQGSGLAAAKAIDTAIRDQAEKQGGKVLNATGKMALSTAKAAGRVTKRRTQAAVRVGLKKFVDSKGHDNGTGGKTFTIGGKHAPKWLTRGLEFTTVKNADGSTYLKRNFKSVTGRMHEMVSDKYMTIKKEYDKNGNEVGSHVEFKHNFAKEYLLDKKGNLNVAALQTLLNSDLAKDPKYREAILAQVATDVLKARGHELGKFYNSRGITIDPNDPSKILIEQVDHSGRVTKVEMQINMSTGQVYTKYDTKVSKTNTMRRGKIAMAKDASWLARKLLKKNTIKILGMTYQLHTDPQSGETYYTKTAKKYLLFGSRIEKTYRADGTERHVTKSQHSMQKHQERLQKMAYKVTGGMPNAHGGLTKKGLFHTYESRVDSSGNVTFSKTLRSGWNIKNYFRAGKNTVKLAVKLPFKAVTYPLVHPTKTVKAIFHPARTINNAATAAQGIAAQFKNDWRTGNVKTYSNEGKTVRRSNDGRVLKKNLMDKTVTVTKDGDKITKDNLTGETSYTTMKASRYESFIDNGMVTVKTTGIETADGSILSEVTKFQYAEHVQKGHDSIIDRRNGNQVVEADGRVADDIDANALLFGLSPHVKDNILAEGRRRHTNKMETRIGSGMTASNLTDQDEDREEDRDEDREEGREERGEDNTQQTDTSSGTTNGDNTETSNESSDGEGTNPPVSNTENLDSDFVNKVTQLTDEFSSYIRNHPEITNIEEAKKDFMRSHLNPLEFSQYCHIYH